MLRRSSVLIKESRLIAKRFYEHATIIGTTPDIQSSAYQVRIILLFITIAFDY